MKLNYILYFEHQDITRLCDEDGYEHFPHSRDVYDVYKLKPEITEWIMEQNLTAWFCGGTDQQGVSMEFTSQDDALLFKLTWGGQ